VAAVLSERLFGQIPFGGRDLALFDEVPALRLEGDFIGLFVAIHGEGGEYILLLRPKPKTLRGQGEVLYTDFSNYIAELVRSLEMWRVEVPKA